MIYYTAPGGHIQVRRVNRMEQKYGKRTVSRMDTCTENNVVRLCGVMAGAPLFSHGSRGQDFYGFPLAVRRLSGNCDTLNIVLRASQLDALRTLERDRILITWELRSFNNRRAEGAKLVLTVFAREIAAGGDEDENLVALTGTLCKPPNLRVTPMGRDICDLMLAVNRRYGRSDYLPCICWGLEARKAARWPVGAVVRLEGRFQSRPYLKLLEDGSERRVAYEVSAAEVEALEIPERAETVR